MVSLPIDMASFALNVFHGLMLVFFSVSTCCFLFWLMFMIHGDEPIEENINLRNNFNPIELFFENPNLFEGNLGERVRCLLFLNFKCVY